MAKSKEQFLAIAQSCTALSILAPTVEERDTFLDFARKWKKMTSEVKRHSFHQMKKKHLQQRFSMVK